MSDGGGDCGTMDGNASSTEASLNGTDLTNRTSTIFSIGPDFITQW
jgi:hypothetical protein